MLLQTPLSVTIWGSQIGNTTELLSRGSALGRASLVAHRERSSFALRTYWRLSELWIVTAGALKVGSRRDIGAQVADDLNLL